MGLGLGGLQGAPPSVIQSATAPLVISAGVISMPAATTGVAGYVSAAAQTFSGNKTFAGTVLFNSDVTLGASADLIIAVNRGVRWGGTLTFYTGAPTVAAGAGASVTAGTAVAFAINLGGAASTGTITFPLAASTGWIIQMTNITNNALFVISQTGGNTTTATFTCYSRTTGLAINWTANDIARCTAVAY